MSELLEFYKSPGLMTGLQGQEDACAGLPSGIAELVGVVQGLLIHVFWAEKYGRLLNADERRTLNVRSAAEKVALMAGVHDAGRSMGSIPLRQPRPVAERQVGNCRDFSVLLCAFLRQQGIPARARCGFGRYFIPNHHEDHWVCEYWNAAEGRWVMVDAQLDKLQCEAMKIGFDPCDVPADQFWPAGRAWQVCRAGLANPDDFGIFDMHGIWFVRGNLLRDLASLNKVELLPWDGWGLADRDEALVTAADVALLDRVAELTMGGDACFAEMRALYEGDDRLRVPAVIRTYGEQGPQEVAL